jgi:hypothetical protein
MITENSKIEFHSIRFASSYDDHKLFGVIRLDTDDSLKVDKDVMALVQFLKEGKTVKEAAKIINFSPQVILTILHMLDNAHFIKNVDGISVPDNTEKIKPWLTHISRKWFQWILYKPFITIIILFSISGTIVGMLINGIPSYSNFFWTSDLFTVFVSLFIIDILLIFIHESSHFIATRAVGGEALMRINYRYVFIVAETESYHLTIVPKQKRYLVYFAGMMCDLFIVGLIYWFFVYTNLTHMHIGIIHNFLLAVILMQILGIIWEFNIFLETDVYNFLSEYMGFENLRSDAFKSVSHHLAKWKLSFLSPIKRFFTSENITTESDDLRLMDKATRKKLLIYIFVLIGGLIFVTLQYIFYSIPRDVTFILEGMKDASLASHPFDPVTFFKSVIVIILVVYDYFLLFYLKIISNKRLRNKKKKITVK